MPEPAPDPHLPETRRVALHALVAGVIITALKFAVYVRTDSLAVLSDALESIINIAAAGVMLYMLWLASRPPDPEHPYGHGRAQVLAVGLEGWLILFSGLVILWEAGSRLLRGESPNMGALVQGWWFLAGIGVLAAALAAYVYHAGKRFESAPLIADGKHLFTDVASTVAVLIGLALVHWTGWAWLDAVVGILVAAFILSVSWRLLWQSAHDIMERNEPEDLAKIHRVLDEELAGGTIRGYHKVRYRQTGKFHWVDMHLQVEAGLSVHQSHALASRIERRIEDALGEANATAHVEPWIPDSGSTAPRPADNAANPPVGGTTPVAPTPAPAPESPPAPGDGNTYDLNEEPR